MKEIHDLLKEQNKIMAEHTALVEGSIGEFMRILQLQAAEAKVGNARTAIMDDTLQKLLSSVSILGDQSKKLLTELSSP